MQLLLLKALTGFLLFCCNSPLLIAPCGREKKGPREIAAKQQ